MTMAMAHRAHTAEDPLPWQKQHWTAIVGGFIFAFVVGIACAEVTKAFGDWNRGYAWERSLMMWMHQPLPKAVDSLMLVFPWFGTNISLIPAIAIVCIWLWRRGDKHMSVRLGIVQLGSYLLNPSLKALFDRARPDLFERRGWYGWSSYPSGHAIASVSVLMTVAIILHRVKGWVWPYYVFIPIMLASLYSRVYLGVHWPTDVIAGIVVGVAWLLVSLYAFRERGFRELEREKLAATPSS